MPFEDHLVEVIRLLGGQPPEGEVVDDEQIGRQQTPQQLFGRVIGPRLVELLEHPVGAQEEHGMAGSAGGVTERAGEEGLAHAHGAEKDHVLAALEESEAEEILDEIAVEGHGRVPVEAFEGLFFLEARAGDARRQVLLVAPVDLVLQDELEELELIQLRLLRVRRAFGERCEKAREFQALHHGLERLADLHGLPPCVGG